MQMSNISWLFTGFGQSIKLGKKIDGRLYPINKIINAASGETLTEILTIYVHS